MSVDSTSESTEYDSDELDGEEWFTLDDIVATDDDSEDLYCIAVDSPDKQFLVGLSQVPTHNTDEGKEEDALHGEAVQIIGSIARLGRAAGVHLVNATQRPDANILPGEVRENLPVRGNCGHTKSSASTMILGNDEGTRVKAAPRGRLYLQVHGSGSHAQGFFCKQDWVIQWLASQGKNPDGTPLNGGEEEEELVEVDGPDDDGELDNADIDYDGDEEPEELDDDESELSNMPESIREEERPELLGAEGEESKFDRPEDDWDSDLENIIKQNNKGMRDGS